MDAFLQRPLAKILSTLCTHPGRTYLRNVKVYLGLFYSYIGLFLALAYSTSLVLLYTHQVHRLASESLSHIYVDPHRHAQLYRLVHPIPTHPPLRSASPLSCVTSCLLSIHPSPLLTPTFSGTYREPVLGSGAMALTPAFICVCVCERWIYYEGKHTRGRFSIQHRNVLPPDCSLEALLALKMTGSASALTTTG